MFEELLSTSRFFEGIDDYVYDDELVIFATKLLPSWRLVKDGIFIHARPPVDLEQPLPNQGFKIHISPDLEKLDKQFYDVLTWICARNIAFKFMLDKKVLRITNSKLFSRLASGKFITLYPCDTEEFVHAARDLATIMNDYSGQYILTDKRAFASKVVYYRYGGFKSMTKRGSDGELLHLIEGPGNELVLDERHPGRAIPSWIHDPLDDNPKNVQSKLMGSYHIDRVLRFTNAGGVYIGRSKLNDYSVFIKEARPKIGKVGQQNLYYRDILIHEYRALKRLSNCIFTPNPFELVEDWEGHTYLVQQQINWLDWHQFFGKANVILQPFQKYRVNLKQFCSKFFFLLNMLITAVKEIHDQGLVHGDISTSNILVSPDGDEIKIVDFESASVDGSTPPWAPHWGTRGFISKDRNLSAHVERGHDWFAVSQCIIASLLPIPNLPTLTGHTELALLERLVIETGLPEAVVDIFKLVLEEDIDQARKIIEFQINIFSGNKLESSQFRTIDYLRKVDRMFDFNNLQERRKFHQRGVEFLRNNYRKLSHAYFWPNASPNESGSKWNIEHGVSGIALCLSREEIGYASEALDAGLNEMNLKGRIDRIGLYDGVAGVGMSKLVAGVAFDHSLLIQQLRKIIEESNLNNISLYSGLSGIGLYAISVMVHIGLPSAELLLQECMRRVQGAAILNLDLQNSVDRSYINCGLLDGFSGVMFFLSQCCKIQKSDETEDLCLSLGRFIVNKSVVDDFGRSMWLTRNGKAYPFWGSGITGIASSLLRVGTQFSDGHMVHAAKGALHFSYSKYAGRPGQFDGLAGILDTCSDFMALSPDDEVCSMRSSILSALDMFVVQYEDGATFVDPMFGRLSCDASTGLAGILSALKRVSGELPGARPLLDFNLPSAKLFKREEV